MAEIKTKATTLSPIVFLNKITPDQKKKDGLELLEIFKKVTGQNPIMWGTSIVGFGKYHYKSDRSTQEGDWPLIAFSPRKQNLTLYIMPGFDGLENSLTKLGKHKTSKGCLYINKLTDIDKKVLTQIIEKSYKAMKKKYA